MSTPRTLTRDDLVELDTILRPVAGVLDAKLTRFEALMVAHALRVQPLVAPSFQRTLCIITETSTP